MGGRALMVAVGGLLSLLQPYQAAITAQPFSINDTSLDPSMLHGMPEGPGGPSNVSPSGGSSRWEDVARRMAMRRFGYSPQDFNKLDSIISRESGWNPNAVNPSSGAYGIPQILPSAHPDVNLQDDPKGQIGWLLRYIQGRYGGVDQALAFKDSHGWY